MSWDDERVREHVRHLEGLLCRLEDIPGGAPAIEAVQALTALYGEALARVTRIAADTGMVADLVRDELLGHLLVLHGLHPEPLDVRVRRALSGIETFLGKHQARAELVGTEGGVVRLAVGAQGCSSTSRAVTRAVEDAVHRAAPEVDRVEIASPDPAPVLIPLDRLRGGGT